MPRIEIDEGSGSFTIDDSPHTTGKSLTVWYHRPQTFNRHTPIVILLHGLDRAGAYFRDCWCEHAERYGFLVLAPEYDEITFPGPENYNYGNVVVSLENNAKFNPPCRWTYRIIDLLFEKVRQAVGSTRPTFSLFGHSAGAQFAHRYLALTASPNVDLTVAANAGWYMMPDTTLRFPAGLGGLDIADETVRHFLARHLILLLGSSDIQENAADLPTYAEAIAQGENRLERGKNYFEQCRRKAMRMCVVHNWRISIAHGVGHYDKEVAGPAAKLIAEYLRGESCKPNN